MALGATHQHFGRPGTPTDQAWTWVAVRPRQGRVAHLAKIGDPVPLRAEFASVREQYNAVRLTAGAGAVWAATTGGRLLRIDPRSARVAAALSVPADTLTADANLRARPDFRPPTGFRCRVARAVLRRRS
jgi:hypothetical protein